MHRNIFRIKTVASCLAALKEKVVFTGGATVSLYATNRAAVAEVRPTEDVDVVIELISYAEYASWMSDYVALASLMIQNLVGQNASDYQDVHDGLERRYHNSAWA